MERGITEATIRATEAFRAHMFRFKQECLVLVNVCTDDGKASENTCSRRWHQVQEIRIWTTERGNMYDSASMRLPIAAPAFLNYYRQ